MNVRKEVFKTYGVLGSNTELFWERMDRFINLRTYLSVYEKTRRISRLLINVFTIFNKFELKLIQSNSNR